MRPRKKGRKRAAPAKRAPIPVGAMIATGRYVAKHWVPISAGIAVLWKATLGPMEAKLTRLEDQISSTQMQVQSLVNALAAGPRQRREVLEQFRQGPPAPGGGE